MTVKNFRLHFQQKGGPEIFRLESAGMSPLCTWGEEVLTLSKKFVSMSQCLRENTYWKNKSTR